MKGTFKIPFQCFSWNYQRTCNPKTTREQKHQKDYALHGFLTCLYGAATW